MEFSKVFFLYRGGNCLITSNSESIVGQLEADIENEEAEIERDDSKENSDQLQTVKRCKDEISRWLQLNHPASSVFETDLYTVAICEVPSDVLDLFVYNLPEFEGWE